MKTKNKKFKKLVAAVMLGVMTGVPVLPMMSVAYAETTTNNTGAMTKEQMAQAVLGSSGILPVPGSTAKYNWTSSTKEVQAYPICTGTKAPTQNETASFNCIVVGNNAYGAAIPISGTVTGGKQSLSGIAPFMYKVKVGQDPKTGKTLYKTQFGVMNITININGYQGKTTMGASDGWDSFESGVNPWNNYDDGFGNGSSDGLGKWGTDDGGPYEGLGGDGGITNNGLGWGNGDYGGESNTKGSNACPDGTFYCSDNGESNTLFGDGNRKDSETGKPNGGYWGDDGKWHGPDGSTSDTDPYGNDQSNSPFTDGGSSGGTSGGYWGNDGKWHGPDGSVSDTDPYGNNKSNSPFSGGGSTDGGYTGGGYTGGGYTGGGSTGGTSGGYWGEDGKWHGPDGSTSDTDPYGNNQSDSPFSGGGTSGGYWGSDGKWHGPDGSVSDTDPYGNSQSDSPFAGGGSSSGTSGGYWGEDGKWHGPDGSTSYTDPYGNNQSDSPFSGGGSSGGYWGNDGKWHNPDGSVSDTDPYGNNRSNSPFAGGGSSGGASVGYWGEDGKWHGPDGSTSDTDPYGNNQSDSPFSGGGSSGGYWGSDGKWHNPDGSVSDTDPYGNNKSNSPFSGGGSSGGYWGDDGKWHNPDGSTGIGNNSSSGYYDKDGNWHNSNGSTSSNPYSYDNNSNSNYGNLINDLLNTGNDSYNSGDADWANSKGGSSGSSDLDDYFNGIGGENNADSLEGITDDLLGLAEDLFNADGATADSLDGANADWADGNENGDANGDDNFFSSEDGDSLTDNAEVWDNSSDSLQDLMNAMDGISGNADEDGFTDGTDGNGESSLANGLSKFIRSVTGNADKGVTGVDITEQDLFELAKKLLMANGMSLDDILKGKNYDRGSAYTEPRQAWDMNRITKLLASGKIKIQKEDLAKNKQPSSITNASNRNKVINANR